MAKELGAPAGDVRAVQGDLAAMRREFHAAVKAAGAAPTQLLVYPDSGHPIERVEDEADHWLAVASWFEEHLPRVR